MECAYCNKKINDNKTYRIILWSNDPICSKCSNKMQNDKWFKLKNTVKYRIHMFSEFYNYVKWTRRKR